MQLYISQKYITSTVYSHFIQQQNAYYNYSISLNYYYLFAANVKKIRKITKNKK